MAVENEDKKVEVTDEQIVQMSKEGFTATEIGEKFGISKQKVGQVVARSKKALVPEIVKPSGIKVFSTTEYEKYSKENGRTSTGGEIGKEVPYTIEELRVHINSDWKPSMVMEKKQISAEKLQGIVNALSVREMRSKSQRIKVDFKRDFFRG